MKLSDFDFRIWDGKEYLKQRIFNDNKNKNEYFGITSDLAQKGEKSQHQILKLEHFAEQNYGYGDYDEICRVKDFTDYTENVEIELWTGFYDKNGEKIYEGDILKIENKTLAKVEFNLNDGFFYTTISEKKEFTYKFSFHAKGDLEIIGNIHENKNLLK